MAFQIVLFMCLLALASAAPSANDEEPKTVIIGGRNAVQGEFPHQVSLQSAWSSHFCGGIILGKYWILTAAHCITTSNIIVKAGKHNVYMKEATEQSIPVVRTVVHKLYAGEVGPYDIALLKLSTPLSFNQYVQSIKLPAAGSEPSGTGILSGWGSMSKTTQPLMPSILQTVTLSLLNATSCTQSMTKINSYTGSKIVSTNVCTAAGNDGSSACNGDSGGPLISNINGVKEVIGVVSWGMIPCGTQAPTVYTKVSSFVNWINNVVHTN